MRLKLEKCRDLRNHRGLAKDCARKARFAKVEVVLPLEVLGQSNGAVRLAVLAFEFEPELRGRLHGEADDGEHLVRGPESSEMLGGGLHRAGRHTCE